MFVFGFVQGLGCKHRSSPIVEGDSATACAGACKKKGGLAIIFEYYFARIAFHAGQSCLTSSDFQAHGLEQVRRAGFGLQLWLTGQYWSAAR